MKAAFRIACAVAILLSPAGFAETAVVNPGPLAEEIAADLPYRAALYRYNTGNYLQGLMELSYAKRNAELMAHRELLSGRLNLELKRYLAAQAAFDSLAGNESARELVLQASFPLARLFYVKRDCANVLAVLKDISGLPVELDSHARFMRASCTVQQPGDNSLQEAEKIILESVTTRKERHPSDIWFAYAYYNIGAAAAQRSLTSDADRYFREALKYTGDTEEGLGLANRTLLSLAHVNYAANRFEFAMNAFAEMPLDGLWADKSLLGFGWSAFKQQKPGVAMEAWRQLVNLPFKSLSVYEGYIAIPFALEKARSYSDAWSFYKMAISEYSTILAEIDKLSASLTMDRIRLHADEYAQSEGKLIAPLHPLLAYTYAQDDFRILIEQVGEVRSYQKRLEYYVENLNILNESRTKEKNAKRMGDEELAQRQASIEESLARLDKELPLLADQLLEGEVLRPGVDPLFKTKYEEYLRLKQMVQRSSSGQKTKQEMNARLDRLKGVLIGQLYEQSRDQFGYIEKVTALTRTHHQLEVRYGSFLNMRKADYQPVITDSHLQDQQARIAELKSRCDEILLVAQKQLLDKTQLALDEQKKRITEYRYQARVAKTRLEEEFFQRGSQGL